VQALEDKLVSGVVRPAGQVCLVRARVEDQLTVCGECCLSQPQFVAVYSLLIGAVTLLAVAVQDCGLISISRPFFTLLFFLCFITPDSLSLFFCCDDPRRYLKQPATRTSSSQAKIVFYSWPLRKLYLARYPTILNNKELLLK